MKYAISNIAWQKEEDEQIYKIMERFGFTGLEIAPSRIWEAPLKTTKEEVRRFKEEMHNRGISIVSLQALHFGHPELTVFENPEIRKKTLDHTKRCIDLASELEAKALVFGSPKNRLINDMNYAEAETIAIDFFTELGNYAKAHNTAICIEPNPRDYGADFITRTEEAVNLVRIVNNDGFRLNLDTSTMTLNNEDYEKEITHAFPRIGHIHISEPMLELVSGREDNSHHDVIAGTLRSLNYEGWISIEMKSGLTDSNVSSVQYALQFVADRYREI